MNSSAGVPSPSSLRYDDDPFKKFRLRRPQGENVPARSQSLVRYRRIRLVRNALAALILLGMVFVWCQWRETLAPTFDGNEQLRHVQADRQQRGKENASFVMLVRNSELGGALRAMKQIEERFNHKYKYPWTFLNDQPFTKDFIEQTTKWASGKVEHGLISNAQWSVPDHIDKHHMQQTLDDMGKKKILYGSSISYRSMCRYQSGFFWRHELVAKYDYYWRVEPDIGFFCDIDYDVFTFMRENKKKYGFVISLREYAQTIPTLWASTKEFIRLNPQYLAVNSSLTWITQMSDGFRMTSNSPPDMRPPDLERSLYNLCHFWSNFEIGNLNFWRSEAYTKYFEFLDKKGGFFYERWGDAPVHSIAASLFLNRDEIHFFHDIGYKHHPMGRCPFNEGDLMDTAKCVCPFPPEENFDTAPGYGCTLTWWLFSGLDHKTGAPKKSGQV